jgi:predicted AAA+ superfamily ATPase
MKTPESLYIHRTLSDEIIQMSLFYPIVTITGPRQSGKTALVRKIFVTPQVP